MQQLTITVRGESTVLDLDLIGAADTALVRRATNGEVSLRDLLGKINQPLDLDEVGVLWWLARARAGDDVAYEQAIAEMPTYTEFGVKGRDVLDMTFSGGEQDGSPEA